MATAKSTRYVATEQQEEYDEVASFSFTDEQPAEDETGNEPRCATCGELLAWHEQACVDTARPVLAAEEAEVFIAPPAAGPGFAYELGGRVLPATSVEARVIVWRGQLKERHPATGLVQRVPVYRLDDGYWDCYREEELLMA